MIDMHNKTVVVTGANSEVYAKKLDFANLQGERSSQFFKASPSPTTGASQRVCGASARSSVASAPSGH